MSGGPGVLAMTLVVRDEEEILASNLDYHLAQGVDVILVIDHGSSDATAGILSGYERGGRVRSFRDDAPGHHQVARVNRLLAVAAEQYAAEWVIHCDADEFWMPAIGSLRDVFRAVPDAYGYVVVQRNDFVPVECDGEPFHQRMVIRHRSSRTIRGTRLEPKVAQRPAAAVSVVPGNHDLESPLLQAAPDIGALEVLHFPMRTLEQFERKVIKSGVGHERLGRRPPGVGCDQMALLAMQRRGELRGYWDASALDRASIERGLEQGGLVLDRRLGSFMRSGPSQAPDSPAVTELLRGAWMQTASAAEALTASEERARDLAAQLEAAVRSDARAAAEVEELRLALAAIQASRTLRYTAPLRRRYHRLRGMGNARLR